MNEKQKKNRLKEECHSPLAPYFATAYTTLLSVTQGVIFATLLFAYNECKDLSFSTNIGIQTILMLVIAFLGIMIIWDKFIAHTQYLGWQLDWFDTVIPFFFAVLQYFMIMEIKRIPHEVAYFGIWIGAISLFGCFTYWRQSSHLSQKPVKNLYSEHFRIKKIGDAFYEFMLSFEKKIALGMFLTALFFIITSIASWRYYWAVLIAFILVIVLWVIFFIKIDKSKFYYSAGALVFFSCFIFGAWRAYLGDFNSTLLVVFFLLAFLWFLVDQRLCQESKWLRELISPNRLDRNSIKRGR